MANKPQLNTNEEGRDVMLTPPYAVDIILNTIQNNQTIWEPAYHPDSLLAQHLEQHGHTVIKTGLPEQDYFNCHPDTYYDVQITNPPYSKKYAWIDRAFSLMKPFALLVPYDTTAANTFVNMLKKYDIDKDELAILHTGTRVDYKTPTYGWGMKIWDEVKQKYIMRGGSAQFSSVWLTWKLNIVYPQIFNTYYAPIKKVRYSNDTEV
jgi:hypothetical protein